MSAGVPAVTSDLPVCLEYLVDGRDALLVPVGDVAALAAALRTALLDRGVRARLVAAGAGVAARYAWRASAERHRGRYTSLGV